MNRRLVAPPLAALLLTACHSVGPEGGKLELSLDPPDIKPGRMITVVARPLPGAELAWVSGTVKVMGAGEVPFTLDRRDGLWKFRTMIPVFFSVPPGIYEVRAWGESRAGRRYQGALKVEIK